MGAVIKGLKKQSVVEPVVQTKSDEVFLARYRKAHSIKQAGILDKIQDTVSPALRWTIFGVNVFFWCVGIFFMFLGVWAFIQKTQKLKSRTVESAIDVFTDIGIVFACLGLIIFALAFTGCVGVLRQNIRLLKFYKSVLMGILAIQFLMLIALIAFTTVSVQYVQKLIKATAITKYREDVDLQNIIDFIQFELQCCGVGEEGYKDWNINSYFNCTDSNQSPEKCSLPFSCCIAPNDINKDIINTKCAYKVQELNEAEVTAVVWPLGCLIKINSLVQQQAIYSAIGLVIYVFCYCIVIEVVERLIRQINTFREDYLHLDNKKDSIDDVSINDFVKKRYRQVLKDRNIQYEGIKSPTIATPINLRHA